MEIVQYTQNHWAVIKDWWLDHGWSPIPDNFLPNTGFLVYDNAAPVCVGFLYRTDSAIAILEWVLADKKSDKQTRDRCLDLLIDALIAQAVNYGFRMIHTSIKHPSLLERMKKHGFAVSDEQMTNLSFVMGA